MYKFTWHHQQKHSIIDAQSFLSVVLWGTEMLKSSIFMKPIIYLKGIFMLFRFVGNIHHGLVNGVLPYQSQNGIIIRITESINVE